MKRIRIVAIAGILLAGCSINSTFRYDPNASSIGGPNLPAKLAVLPFRDGTEEFTVRGNLLFSPEYNLAKGGISGHMTALTPELFAKAFADELKASGRFRAVRLVYDRSELSDEDFLVDGSLQKAVFTATVDEKRITRELVLDIRATRRSDGNAIWEKRVARSWRNPSLTFWEGAPWAVQGRVDRDHADFNRQMRSMLSEAAADLAARLAPLAGGGAGAGEMPSGAPSPEPAPGSVDETIEGILHGN